MYDGQRFAKGGFRMHELFFHDGTCPSEAILQAFLAIAKAEPGEGSYRAFVDRVLWGLLWVCPVAVPSTRRMAVEINNSHVLHTAISRGMRRADKTRATAWQARWRCTARRAWDGRAC